MSNPCQTRHADIGKDEIERLLGYFSKPLGAITDRFCFEPFLTKNIFQ